jgi:hypothetical protein
MRYHHFPITLISIDCGEDGSVSLLVQKTPNFWWIWEGMEGEVAIHLFFDFILLLQTTKNMHRRFINAPNSRTSRFFLSVPKTNMENSVVVSNYAAMDCILCIKRKYILNMCKKIKKCSTNIVLIQKSILCVSNNELSLHFLAKMGILLITDIEHTDVEFVCCTLGCTPIPHVDSLLPEKLRSAEHIGNLGWEIRSEFRGIPRLFRF